LALKPTELSDIVGTIDLAANTILPER
jgi:hypothetical protein